MAFVASLGLSWVAIHGSLVNRDGIFYLNTARTITELGLGGLQEVAGLNFLPLLIAAFSSVSALPLESAAKVMNSLFLAGACALMVDCVKQKTPTAAWIAALVVLAMPAYNQYRNEILRENGFWFFSLLGFWLAMQWTSTQRWQQIVLAQLSLLLATLFRLEAVAFFLAFFLWQFSSAPTGSRLKAAVTFVSLPLACTVLLAILFATGIVKPSGRLLYYLEAIDPLRKLLIFEQASARLSDLVLPHKYSREEAWYILLFGLLAIIPIKFFKMLGLLLIPFAYIVKVGIRPHIGRWQLLSWAFVVYVLVLAVFVTHQMFLVGRYVSMLNLLAVPLVAVGFMQLADRFPRWQPAMVVLACVMIVANVVSLSPRQTHILEAGEWLKHNARERQRIGVENGRIAYYAGWKLEQANIRERAALVDALANRRLDIAALEVGHKEVPVDAWLGKKRLIELHRFIGPKGDAVVIVAPAEH